MKQVVLIGVFLLGLAIGWATSVDEAADEESQSGASPTDVTRQEREENQAWHERFLGRNISHLRRLDDESVHVRTAGNLYGEGRERELTLRRYGALVQHDHHGGLRYRLEQVRDDGVVFSYFSYFDHTSFGTPVVTRERGEVFVPFTPVTSGAGGTLIP